MLVPRLAVPRCAALSVLLFLATLTGAAWAEETPSPAPPETPEAPREAEPVPPTQDREGEKAPEEPAAGGGTHESPPAPNPQHTHAIPSGQASAREEPGARRHDHDEYHHEHAAAGAHHADHDEHAEPDHADEREPRDHAHGSEFWVEAGDARVGLGLALQAAAAWFSSPETLQAGAHEPTKNGFTFREAELGLFGEVDPFLEVACAIGFSPTHFTLEEAWAGTRRLPFGFRLRGGIFLTRFGLDNPTHAPHFAFIDRPFAITRVLGSHGSISTGAELSYMPSFVEGLELVATAAGADGASTARSFYGGNDLGVQRFRHLLWVGRAHQKILFPQEIRLGVGISGAFGPNSTGRDNHTEVYGADVQLTYGRGEVPVLMFAVEGLHRRRQVPRDLLRDNSGYAMVLWRLVESLVVGGRYDVGAPYSSKNGLTLFDPLDPTWTKTRHRVSLNLAYLLSHKSRLMLQGSRDIDGPYLTPGGQKLGQHWALFLGANVQLGAHDLSETHEH